MWVCGSPSVGVQVAVRVCVPGVVKVTGTGVEDEEESGLKPALPPVRLKVPLGLAAGSWAVRQRASPARMVRVLCARTLVGAQEMLWLCGESPFWKEQVKVVASAASRGTRAKKRSSMARDAGRAMFSPAGGV